MTSPTITDSVSLTLPQISIAEAKPPETYLGIAHHMLLGVKILASASLPPSLPLAMLSAHVLECALKAYLSRSGDDSRLMKKNLRHNLNALWSLANAEGLKIPSQPYPWVEILSHLHDSPYYLRYSTGVHCLQTPAPQPMVAELENFVTIVRTQLS
ncbi:hypothetical protein [Rugamonas apoptosis]|uniref:HEPN domain-containing protein n=1 Tax=Rugamonas apoptosis TaxID=2758570 RepID=A0A7W2IMK7_9BURK|nr:hypothetical protein [Rugamonas apoptosis]MBA5689641.1 hypothetical protein [Rugamonas apoptosis]